ncbi:MAG: tetratricopeptide repeat protein [Acidobacteriaceae bacterium]|nr:tetratricopeptide repeat protein [Acidobacteriaceae bacterium]
MLIAGAMLTWAMTTCFAQTKTTTDYPAPCSVAPVPVPCGSSSPASGKTSTTEKFPFPGEPTDGSTSSSAPNLTGVPSLPEPSGNSAAPAATPSAPTNPAPNAPAPASGKTAADFPFPDESEPKSGDANAPGATNANNAASSSSSSSSSDDASAPDPDAKPDSAAPAMKDEGSEGSQATPGRHLLHRVNPVATKLQTADQREAEDLSVAHYYTQTGDLQGAYLRSKDAVKTIPDDPAAHLALAEVALKLDKRDEAIAEFNACLKFDPTDKQAATAHKALARLKP